MNATEVEAVRLNAFAGNDSPTVSKLTGVEDLNSITFSGRRRRHGERLGAGERLDRLGRRK